MELYQSVTDAAFDALRNRYSENVFNLWFRELQVVEIDEHNVILSAPFPLKQRILMEHYRGVLEEVFSDALGFPITVNIVSRNENPADVQSRNREIERENERRRDAEEAAEEERRTQEITRNIEGKDQVAGYTFENFIVGDSNRFAYAACWAVAQSFTTDEEILTDPLEDKYNPLFIYGPSGIGKTHLLYAITNEIKKRTPDTHIIYIRGEDFVNELIESIRRGSTAQFRNKYRTTDVLLIDDIHFIAGKESVQEEFFNTFNTLYDNQRQIILTSDRPPCEIKNLTDRLRTRFEWGLSADIQPPTPELRAAIIKMKAEKQGMPLSDEIITYMANKITDNIRTIEGAIRKLSAMRSLTGSVVSLETVKRALSDVQSGGGENSFLVDRIFTEVSKRFDMPVDTIKSTRRQTNIVYARQICMYLLRNLTPYSSTEIGAMFGRDHSTVLGAIAKVEDMIEADPAVREDVDILQARLNAKNAK